MSPNSTLRQPLFCFWFEISLYWAMSFKLKPWKMCILECSFFTLHSVLIIWSMLWYLNTCHNIHPVRICDLVVSVIVVDMLILIVIKLRTLLTSWKKIPLTSSWFSFTRPHSSYSTFWLLSLSSMEISCYWESTSCFMTIFIQLT